MTKKVSHKGKKGTFSLVVHDRDDKTCALEAGEHIVKYGVVFVHSHEPKRPAGSVKSSQEALKRAKNKLLRPGVKLNVRKGAALYRADPDNPHTLIREIDGRLERGTFEGKTFKVGA